MVVPSPTSNLAPSSWQLATALHIEATQRNPPFQLMVEGVEDLSGKGQGVQADLTPAAGMETWGKNSVPKMRMQTVDQEVKISPCISQSRT